MGHKLNIQQLQTMQNALNGKSRYKLAFQSALAVMEFDAVQIDELTTMAYDCKFEELNERMKVKDINDAAKYRSLNTPEIKDFLKAVENEALHQRDRWGDKEDAGKTDLDWFWLIGYLAGKAIHKPEKILHHIITTAAVCLNWHAAKIGVYTDMRPGILSPPLRFEGYQPNPQNGKPLNIKRPPRRP